MLKSAIPRFSVVDKVLVPFLTRMSVAVRFQLALLAATLVEKMERKTFVFILHHNQQQLLQQATINKRILQFELNWFYFTDASRPP